TNTRIVKIFGYNGSNGHDIAKVALEKGYDAIKYTSVKDGGVNYAILQNGVVKIVENVSTLPK
ncbi:MAG: hypothetical protein D3923_18605, partial [Candidatus Electrothrix sp. AR3]|nr:hypothetical protein [Candidatus Electrothrix sp. AR3]